MPGDAINISRTRYAEPNALIRMTFDSLAAQQDLEADILFLVQKECPETKTYQQSLGTPRLRLIFDNIPARNPSFARNIAIEKSPNDIILVIDPDTTARGVRRDTQRPEMSNTPCTDGLSMADPT